MEYFYLLALGSNVGNREEHVERALARLEQIGRVLRCSKVVETAPLSSLEYDVSEQASYLNCVCEFSTSLAPADLYEHIRHIEDDIGHPRHRRWLPREMDIDLLFCGRAELDSRFVEAQPVIFRGKDGFQVPHAHFWSREFLVDLVMNDMNIQRTILTRHSLMKRVIFLGTPEVAAVALDLLARGFHDMGLELVAVVAQPPARSLRKGGETPCPVHVLATKLGVPVLTPATARDPEFLTSLKTLAPDLCITAAYGNFLPQTFLDIPRYGTINIHPSLLPRFRGAAPAQRAIESGCVESGVTLCMTVLAMDAGPILAQDRVQIGADETAPEFLARMFQLGARHLLSILPAFFAGDIAPKEQNSSEVSHAAKVAVEESWIDFSTSASAIHNKMRAFAGWPGTRARFRLGDDVTEIKLIRSTLCPSPAPKLAPFSCLFQGGKLYAGCGDGSVLELLELQLPGKKAMAARDFWNGLRDKRMEAVKE